jgi:hypothetical protein
MGDGPAADVDPERHVAKGVQNYEWGRVTTTTGKVMIRLRLWHSVGLTTLLWTEDYVRKMCQDGLAACTGITLASSVPPLNGQRRGG